MADGLTKKAKKSGRAGGTRGGWVEKDHFPIGGPPRNMGGLPRISKHLVLSGIIPTGIKYMVDYKPIGL